MVPSCHATTCQLCARKGNAGNEPKNAAPSVSFNEISDIVDRTAQVVGGAKGDLAKAGYCMLCISPP